MTGLAEFFEEMRPFLLGERSADDVLARLGPSPSGTPRFALYAELVARQRRSVIDGFYRSVKAAAASPARATPSLFAELRDAYLAAHPPSHWSPNEAARGFSAFLEARGAGDDLCALADYAWVVFAVMHAAHEPGDGIGLDTALFVRHYGHDVASYVDALDEAAGPAARREPTTPELSAVPRTMLVSRHRRAGTLVVVTPSLAALLALASATASEPPALPSGVTWPDVIEGAVELEALGVVGPDVSKRVAQASRR